MPYGGVPPLLGGPRGAPPLGEEGVPRGGFAGPLDAEGGCWWLGEVPRAARREGPPAAGEVEGLKLPPGTNSEATACFYGVGVVSFSGVGRLG